MVKRGGSTAGLDAENELAEGEAVAEEEEASRLLRGGDSSSDNADKFGKGKRSGGIRRHEGGTAYLNVHLMDGDADEEEEDALSKASAHDSIDEETRAAAWRGEEANDTSSAEGLSRGAHPASTSLADASPPSPPSFRRRPMARAAYELMGVPRFLRRLCLAFGWRFVVMVVSVYGVNQGMGEGWSSFAVQYLASDDPP